MSPDGPPADGSTTDRQRSWWGWGWDDEAVPAAHIEALAPLISERLGAPVEVRAPAALDDLYLRPSWVQAPPLLAALCSADPRDRAGHAYGKSFRDVVRAFHGDVPEPPDVVARPESEPDLVALLEWCDTEHLAAIP